MCPSVIINTVYRWEGGQIFIYNWKLCYLCYLLKPNGGFFIDTDGNQCNVHLIYLVLTTLV